jgi:hypothetical protein
VDAAAYTALLVELSAPQGWTVEPVSDLQPGGIAPEVRVVVAGTAPANIAEVAASAPETQFVVVSDTDLMPPANVSVIRRRAEYQAFLSGFLSALLSPDYRAVGLLPADGPLGGQLAEAFVNGGKYFCGTCAPGWPLNFDYPAVIAQPAASDSSAWMTALADAFDNKKIDVVYLSPEAARPEIIAYLQGRVQFDRAVLVVGPQAPPAELQGQWAASVTFDDLAALREIWNGVSAGQGGKTVESTLGIANTNPALLESGRMRLVEELMEEMRAGRVFPFKIAPE